MKKLSSIHAVCDIEDDESWIGESWTGPTVLSSVMPVFDGTQYEGWNLIFAISTRGLAMAGHWSVVAVLMTIIGTFLQCKPVHMQLG